MIAHILSLWAICTTLPALLALPRGIEPETDLIRRIDENLSHGISSAPAKRADTLLSFTQSSTNATNVTSLKSRIPLTCIEPGAPSFTITSADDCSAAIQVFLVYLDILLPRVFSNNGAGGSIKVPFSKIHGTCIAIIGYSGPLVPARDSFSMINALYYMSEVLLNCVVNARSPWGGYAEIGSGGGFYVSLSGKVNPGNVGDGVVNGSVSPQ